MDRDRRDIEIASFLAGKTVTAIEGHWFTGGIKLIFADSSEMEIDPYEKYGNAYRDVSWRTLGQRR